MFLGVFSKNFSFENLTKMLSFMGRKIYYLCFFYFHRIPLKNESEKHWLLCSFCVFKWFREGFRSWNTFEIFQYFHKIIENTPGNEDVFCWKSGNFRNISPKTFEIRCKNQISQKTFSMKITFHTQQRHSWSRFHVTSSKIFQQKLIEHQAVQCKFVFANFWVLRFTTGIWRSYKIFCKI